VIGDRSRDNGVIFVARVAMGICGGISVRFGDRRGNAVILMTKGGHKDRWHYLYDLDRGE
jgi:hypothetical protein